MGGRHNIQPNVWPFADNALTVDRAFGGPTHEQTISYDEQTIGV